MATGQPSVSGISSRRSACDKCRFLKARCLRGDPNQARCDRCSRADSECVTSPIFRLRSWQPPTGNDDAANLVNSSNETNKRQRRSSQHQQLPTPTQSTVSLDLRFLNAGGEHSPPNTAITYQSLDWARQSSMPSLPPDARYREGHQGQINTTFGITGIGFDMNAAEDFFTTTPAATSVADPATSISSLSTPSREFAAAFAPQISPDCPLQTSDDNALRYNNQDNAPIGTEQTPLQQISTLNYELVTFLGRINQTLHKGVLSTLFNGESDSSLPSAMDDILNKATEFVDVLKLLAGSSLPPSTSILEPIRSDSVGTRRSSCSSICSDYASTADSPSQLQPPASPPPSPHKLDTPSMLLILSIYIRLLRLHSIVFAHLSQYLKDLSESEDPYLHPVLRLSISRIPIGMLAISQRPLQVLNSATDSGNLQFLVLIQIVTSLFERMEALLGLPREFRISKRRGDERGLLSVPDFLDLTKSILVKEDDETGENGKGGIKALRKHISKAKQLLRERIAP